VWGKNALFTDPLSRGGEKASYTVPTYQALIGIAESIYWKPTFIYVIDKVRIMRQIKVESKAIRPIKLDGSPDLSYYSYLKDVRYQVQLHIKWNLQRNDLIEDRNIKKHMAIFKRALRAGGRRDVFLGTRECQGYVKPVEFDDGVGFYDDDKENPRLFGMMVHGFNYPDETGDPDFSVRLWQPKMIDGVIDFKLPEEITSVQRIRTINIEDTDHKPIQSVDALYSDLLGGMMDDGL
jgi:CRISPR-associated protein Cas5d